MKNFRVYFILGFAIFSILFGAIFSLFQSSPTFKSLLNADYQSVNESYYSAWVPDWAKEEEVLNSLNSSNQKLDTLLPSWYSLSEDGRLVTKEPKYKELVLQTATNKNIQLLPTVDNQFDAKRVSKLLADSKLQEELSESLITLAKENNYAGWDINFEQVAESDKERFAQFSKNLNQKLDEVNLILSVTVHARTGTDEDWEKSLGHEYKLLGSSADYIRVMAYDFNHPESSPGPVTPPYNLRQVLEFTTRNIPHEKIIVGLPTYGYDWSSKGGAQGLQFNEMQSVLSLNKGISVTDKQSQAKHGSYTSLGVAHEVWYEDAQTIAQKVSLVKSEFGIYRFSFWRLGGEDPNLWKSLK